MRAEHLKGWLAEVRKEEGAAEKSKVAKGSVAAIRGPGGEETEEKRETDTKKMTHWEKVVALVRADFG